MINPHWLELSLSQINFHGPKGVRAIEVRLYDSWVKSAHVHNAYVVVPLISGHYVLFEGEIRN